ncbi:MAG: tRNA preQ1(34) S-adenosylmethionine ribosyltransferase-isomerase QueA [Fluviibacter sp.]
MSTIAANSLSRLSDYDFELPESLIAQHPAVERSASRLLVVNHNTFADQQFTDLPNLIEPGDLLVMNDTRVLRARFFGQKDTGGQVEVLIERIDGGPSAGRLARAQIRASKSPKPGTALRLAEAFTVTVTGRDGEFFMLALPQDEPRDFWQLTEAHGLLPLPPYITHTPGSDDETRYQTVYAKHPGAVAAPTAGLHFDDTLLARLRDKGIETATVTLHVGAGTFQPVRVENLGEHVMHHEWYHLPEDTANAIDACRARGGKVVAVGTTSLRALESAARYQNIAVGGSLQADTRETDLFIRPGYEFKVVDRLITNFHLPKSTLLMLVSAFAGYDTMRDAYQHAIRKHYRFFSYGDAMLLTRNDNAHEI